MLPPSHVAYTWLALSVAQEQLDVAHDVDYRVVALAAMGPDLIDKPLAWAYFYKRYKSAVLFAHTLLANLGVLWIMQRTYRQQWPYGAAFLGHALLDRLWYFPNTFYWPLRGWRFHVWGKRGSEQADIGRAYWITFTRRPELWGWEVGGLLAFAFFVWRHKLFRRAELRHFLLTGRLLSAKHRAGKNPPP
ncbi:MAG TPA: hypothetical protein P5121_36875 [Caldilineaceae bacterium]|nr:hypothetical protein [Caldilineaceae bacterium]